MTGKQTRDLDQRRPQHTSVAGAAARLATVAAACGALLLTGACGASPVRVGGAPAPAGDCRALLHRLPDTVAGQDRRDVEPSDAAAAAWGDPPVVLRCGVREPRALTPSSQCAEVDGVGWLPQRRESAFRFTTIGRRTNVSVDVPYDYRPAADALVDVATALRQTVPEVRPCV